MNKPKHGGARKGAGRKPFGEKRLNRIFANVNDEQLATLKELGDGNVSQGVRIAANIAKIWKG